MSAPATLALLIWFAGGLAVGLIIGSVWRNARARSELADERDRADALEAALNAQGGPSPQLLHDSQQFPDAEPSR